MTPVQSHDAIAGANQPLAFMGEALVSAATLADYLRAALCLLYEHDLDELGISGQRIVNHVQARLRPIVDFRSSLSEKIFEESFVDPDGPTRSTLSETLADLVEVGDIVGVGDGRFFPSPTRLISLPIGGFLIVSGSVTDALEGATKCGIDAVRFGRFCFVNDAPDAVAVTAFSDWLRFPIESLEKWTRNKLRAPLPAMETDAREWEVASQTEFEVKWTKAVDCSVLEGPLVVRFKNESTGRFNRMIARLRWSSAGVASRSAMELTFQDCSRVLAGLRLISGRERRLSYRIQGDFCSVTVSCYSLPEFLSVLKAFCVDRRHVDRERLSFSFLGADLHRLKAIVGYFGFRLIPRNP